MSNERSVQALSRGLRVLECLSSHPSLAFSALHRMCGFSKGALVRALVTLEREGWVSRRLVDGHYHLCGQILLSPHPESELERLASLAAVHLKNLQQRMIWPSDVAVCTGESMVILDSSRRISPLRLNHHVLAERPSMLWSAMGRAYLAHCSERERRLILRRLRSSGHADDAAVADNTWVTRVIKETKRRGYGVREVGYASPDNRFPGQLGAIAVPIRAGARVLGSLSCVWVESATSREQIVKQHLTTLRVAAEEIGAAFACGGFRKSR